MNVEDLIVAMGFDNKQFEAGVKVSMASLAALKSSLNFGGKNGLTDVQQAADNFQMNGVANATDGLSAKFVALSTVAITALSNIVNKAVDAGLNIAKSLTIAPVMEGFREYETNLNSIQTILANTQASGATLEDVSGNLEELNTYSDQTIYNFSEMARNIGTFTAAGVDLDTSTQSIKGIANLAALSGSNSQQASSAMYQLSQAISAGRVSLEDWNSVVTAGMGGTVFQRALAQTAENMGKLSKGSVALEGDMKNVSIAGKSFRESITAKPGEESWLSSEVLTETLKQFTGDLTDADLAAQGFNAEQIKAIQAQAQVARNAATEVKTVTQLMDTLKEGVTSSWAQTWDLIFGNFVQAKDLWTGVSETIGGLIGGVGEARNQMLSVWKAMGGREDLMAGFKNLFDSLMSIVTPIKQAFQDIFPPTTVANLLSMTRAFEQFTSKLIVGSETAGKLRRTFAGVFAVFGIAWEVVKGLFNAFGQLFGAVQGGSGGFLSLTATIGDFLVRVHEAIKNGEIFKTIFGTLGTVLSAPIALIGNLGQAIGEIVGSVGSATSALRQMYDAMFKGDFTAGPLAEDSKIIDVLFRIREGFQTAASIVEQFWNILAKGDFVGGFFEEDSPIVEYLFSIRESIEKFFSSDGLKLILGGAAGAGLGLAVKKMIQSAFKFGSDDADSFFGTIKGAFASARDTFDGVSDLISGVTDSFKAMQQNLQASTLLKIGLAIGLVAASIKLLSTIEIQQLGQALGGITIAMANLMGAMVILTKFAGAGGLATVPAVAFAMIGLASAVLILSAAVKVLSTLEWEELATGLAGLTGIMAVLVAGAYGLSKAEGPLIRAGIAMIPLAAAIRILTSSVKDLSELSWSELGRGLGAIGALLIGLAGALRLMPKDMPAIGAGLALVAGSVLLFVEAIERVAAMDIGNLIQGIAGVGGALAVIGMALKKMPPSMPAMAAGLLLVSGALVVVTGVISALGSMSFGDLAKGIGGLAVSLGVLAVSLNLMSGATAGAVALGIAAGSLALLLPSILALSTLSWSELLIGLGGLAGTLAIIGGAGVLLAPVVPVLAGLGTGMALLGVGILSVGAGALMFASALQALIGVVAAGQPALVNLMAIIPQMASAFANAVISFVTTLATHATALAGAVKNLVIAMLDAFIEIIPKLKDVALNLLTALTEIIVTGAPQLAQAFTAIVQSFLQVLRDNVPAIIDTVYALMMNFLQTIRDRIPAVVTVVTDIIVAFIGALQNNLPRVIQAGFDFIIGFMNSLAESIRSNTQPLIDAALNVGDAIIDGIIQGIGRGITAVANKAREMAKAALDAAIDFLTIQSPSKKFREVGEYSAAGFVIGLERGTPKVAAAAENMARGALEPVRDNVSGLASDVVGLFETMASGTVAANGSIFDPNSPVVSTLDSIRGHIDGILQGAGSVLEVFSPARFGNIGPWAQNSPVVGTLTAVTQGMSDLGGAAQEVYGILTRNDFTGVGPWEEDSPVVDTIFNIRDGLASIGTNAEQAWSSLAKGDLNGALMSNSDFAATLFNVRDNFEQFRTVGMDSIQGLVNGFRDGTRQVILAAENMANASLDSARRALGIQSPSKEFQTIGEYSIDGLLIGLNKGEQKVNGQGNELASTLMAGFTKGLGKEMPEVFKNIFETLRTGTADVKFWGPNSPLSQQLTGMNKALQEAEMRLAAFYGEVNMADPASVEAYVQKTGGQLKYLAGVLSGLEKTANRAFSLMAEGKGLDKVLGDEEVLSGFLDSILAVIPGVEAALIRVGIAVVDGLFKMIFGKSLFGMIGDFVGQVVRTIGGWFGIEFPVEEELDEANKELEDFLVNVEDTQGRFDKLSKSGIRAITGTLVEANNLVDQIQNNNPTITPILDLSEYNAERAKMDTDFSPTVRADTSALQAQALYETRQAMVQQAAAQPEPQGKTTIEFKQYNSSPKALGHVDIYRRTRSQLSAAKEALGVS